MRLKHGLRPDEKLTLKQLSIPTGAINTRFLCGVHPLPFFLSIPTGAIKTRRLRHIGKMHLELSIPTGAIKTGYLAVKGLPELHSFQYQQVRLKQTWHRYVAGLAYFQYQQVRLKRL